MIEVELPDGTIVEFPDGTPQDVMQTALRRRFASPAPAEAAPPPGPAPAPITQAVMPRDRQQRMTMGAPLADVMLPPELYAPQQPPSAPTPAYPDDQQALMDAFLPQHTPMASPAAAPPEDLSTWGGDLAAGMAGLRNVARGIAATPDVLNFLAPQNYARDIEGIAGDVAGLEAQIAGLDPNDPQAQTLAGIMAALGGVSAGRQADLASPEMAARTAAAQAGLIERMPAMVADEIYASQQPTNPAAQRILDSGDAVSPAREIVQALESDPGGILRTFGLRALPASAPSILAAVVGQFLGGPGGAAAMSGLVGGGTEFGASIQQGITDAAREAGVDLTDQTAIEAWIAGNPDALNGIVQDAMIRSGVISATEAAGGGVAGRVARTTARGGTGARVAGAAAGVPIEGTTEAAGEAAAMQATEGEIDPGEVAAGFFGGAALGAPQAGGQIAAEVIRGRQQQARDRSIADLMTQLEQAGVPDAADVAQGAASTGIEPYIPGQPRQPAPEQPATPPEAPAQSVEPAPAPVAAPAPQDAPAAPVSAPPAQEAPVAPEPAQAEPPTAQQAARQERRNTVFTPDDEPIEVEYQVVEADELISSFDEGFQGDVQPRSRDENANSELQIERIANAPNFRRLNRAPETDRGAPVVGPDGMVESGNGRVTGLRRAYQRGTAAEYRAALEAEYPEAAGMRNPIVVARRITDVDRADFAYRSNKPATMAMSATEDARAEARMIDGEILGLYRGGDIMTAANRPMLRAFIGKLPAAERNRMITAEGGLTADGARRVQAAMFSRAYGSDRLLARMAEAMDDDMRSVTTALTEAAPRIAQMRDQMERGLIAKEGDFVPALVEAVEQVANFRARGEDLATFRAQIDAFADPLSDDVQDIMSALFNEKGTRLASKAAVADFIQRATEAAMKQDTSTGTMAGVEAPPARPAKEIIRAARTEEPAPEQTSFLDGTPDRGGSPDRGRQSPRRAADGGGREADGESLAGARPRSVTASAVEAAIQADLIRSGQPKDLAAAAAKVWREFFDAMAVKTGIPAKQLFDSYAVKIGADLKESHGRLLKQMAGLKAATAPSSADTAMVMLSEGASDREIFDATGWSIGADGGLRFEIDDSAASLKPGAQQIVIEVPSFQPGSMPTMGTTLQDVLDHPDLYRAYPTLRHVRFRLSRNLGDGVAAGIDARASTITFSEPFWRGERLSERMQATVDKGGVTPLGVLMHEIQHLIQSIEGFDRGEAQIQDRSKYRLLAGEVEARNTEGRFRNKSKGLPSETEDVPRQEQITTVKVKPPTEAMVAAAKARLREAAERGRLAAARREAEAAQLAAENLADDVAKNHGDEFGDAFPYLDDPAYRLRQFATAILLGEDIGLRADQAAWIRNRLPRRLSQQDRGEIRLPGGGAKGAAISLLKAADRSTFMHESAHFFLEVVRDLAATHPAVASDLAAIEAYIGKSTDEGFSTLQHETFAVGFEAYLATGDAPTSALATVFEQFKAWLAATYGAIRGRGPEISPAAKAAFDSILQAPKRATLFRAQRKGGAGDGVGEARYGIGTYFAPTRKEAERWVEIVAPVTITGPSGNGEINIRDSMSSRERMNALLRKVGLSASDRPAIVEAVGRKGQPSIKGVSIEYGDAEIISAEIDTTKFVRQTARGQYNEYDLSNPSDIRELLSQGIEGSTYVDERGTTNYVAFNYRPPKPLPENVTRLAGQADGESLADRPTRVGRRPKAGLSPQFMDFSFTNKASVYSHAFRAAGLDPDKAVNLPIEEQLQAVKKAVETTFGITVEIPLRTFQSKNRFGRKVEKTKTDIQSREAVDQLLNAYRNLQMLAHVMAMPEKAIGLPVNGKGITLSLVSKGSLRGALGMYSYTKQGEQRVITLPGMSNSFAHEWAHALDHYMALQADQPMLQGLLTRGMVSNGVQPPLSPKRHLTDAFAHIIWAMYGDGMRIGALRLQLQVQSAQVGPDGKFTPAAKNAQKILTDMREGRLPPANLLSTYFKTSQQYGQLAGDERYYTNPAEMFARAFEALTAKQVEAVSDLPQAFLTKGTWAYQDSDDTRAALTFPKGIDLQQFAVAIGNLQQAMSRINLHGPNAPARAPATHDTLGTRDLLKVDRRQGTVSSEMAAAVENLNTLRNLPAVMKSTTASFAEKTGELYSQAVRTGAATLFAIAARQATPEAKAAVTNIALAVGKQPGAGRRTEGIWEENVRRAHGTRLNKIEGATIKAAKAMGKRALTQEDLRTLRSLLTGEIRTAAPALEGLAKDLRQILNDIWYDLKNAGVEVGYASNYLPHIYDADLAQKDPEGFREAAGNVYRLLFDREVMENDDPETQMKDINAIINGLRNTTEATPKGGRAPAPRLTEADEDMIETFRAARKRLRDLERAQAKSPDPDKFVDKIQDAAAATEAAKADMLEMLRDRWSDYSAERWQIRQGVGMINDFGAIGPTANFLKGRVLPNEAGALMKEFMHENPLDMIMTYSLQAQRRSEYAKIFGADNSKLKNMLEVASKAGATKSDIDMIKMGINAATGRMNPSGSGVAHLATTTFTLGNMALLGFSALSSVAENATTGLRTGHVRDSLRAVATAIAMLVRKKRRGELMELGRTIGLILPYAQDSLMQNRLGMDVLSNRSGLQNMTGRFFILNGLTPLTHYQRGITISVANAVMLRLLRADVRGKRGIVSRPTLAIRDMIAGRKGAFEDGELNEIGIGKEQREALLDWLESLDGGMPRADDLFGPDGQSMHKAGELWSRAIYRLSSETIQDPLKTDRTFMANHPDWSAMYGIMSFIDSFTRNVIWRNLERGLNDGDGKMKTAAKVTANAALMATPMMGLIAAQVLTGIVREAIVNMDKMREIDEDEDEDLAEWLIERGMFRSGMFGRLDPLMNLAYGVRYDTDLASMRAGPYLAHFLRQVQAIIAAQVADNDEDTNTAEVRALEAAYRLFVQPAITAGLSAMSYGRASIWAGRAALAYTSRYPAANEFAEWMLGEVGSRHVGAPPWWETGGNDQTPLTTRFLIRPALEAIRGQ